MEKKNPFITTVGFKKDDPDHMYVAQLLNSMGRGKAQYIVKAVMLYQDMQESGKIPQAGNNSYDYERIRKVVLQVIEERERQLGQSAKVEVLTETPKKEPEQKEDMLMSLDDNVLSGIMASIAMFQQQ